VIDLLIKAGNDESEAAQIVMHRLVAAGVPPPQQGGDARGWRRLLEWRNEISQGFGSQEAQLEYQDFTREIEAIPANERVKRVLDEQLSGPQAQAEMKLKCAQPAIDALA